MELLWEKEKTGTGNKHSTAWKIFKKDPHTVIVDGEAGWLVEASLHADGNVEYDQKVPVPNYVRAKAKSLLKQMKRAEQGGKPLSKPAGKVTASQPDAPGTLLSLGYTQTSHNVDMSIGPEAIEFMKQDDASERERIGMIRTKVVEFYPATKEILLYETTEFRDGSVSTSDSFVMDADLLRAIQKQAEALNW